MTQALYHNARAETAELRVCYDLRPMGYLDGRSPLTPLLANPPGGAAPAPNVPLPYGSDPFAGTPSSLGQVNPVGPAPEEVAGQLLGGQPPPPLAAGTPAPLRTMNEALLAGAQFGMPATGMFVGPRAVGADMQLLAQAKEMAGYGIHPNDIWFKTGWFQGADGGWRYEIPDWEMTTNRAGKTPEQEKFNRTYNDLTDAFLIRRNVEKGAGHPDNIANEIARSLNRPVSPAAIQMAYGNGSRTIMDALMEMDANDPRGQGVPISDVVQHPELWQAYPDLASRTYHEASLNELRDARVMGGYAPDFDIFKLSKNVRPGAEVPILAHELQHAVQKREGWTPGAEWKGDLATYERNAGEVEARNTEARLKLSPLERRLSLPWNTQDFPFEQQLLTGTPGIAANKMTPEQFQRLIDYMRSVQGGQ
jgi:hypothetical protein